MNAIEKEDKVTILLAREINGGGLAYKILSYDVFRDISKKILSMLETEKPVDDALGIVKGIRSKMVYGDGLYTLDEKEASDFVQSFAETYHAIKCAECKAQEESCANCGNEGGDCSRCSIVGESYWKPVDDATK
jgi:hypothetical protein